MLRIPRVLLMLALCFTLAACGGASGSPAPVLVPPVGVTGYSGTSSSVHVMWNRAGEDSGVAGYEVYQDGSLVGEVGAEEHMTDILDLEPETLYRFTVRALDGSGNRSADSAAVSVTTLSADTDDSEPPAAPPGLTAEADGPRVVLLAWEAAEDNIGVTSYDVHQAGARIHTVSGEETTAIITGLRPETGYAFTVVARDAGGNVSPPSNEVEITTGSGGGGGVGVGTAPELFTAEFGEGEGGVTVELRWEPPVTGGEVLEYQIFLDGEYTTTLVWGTGAPEDGAAHSIRIGDAPTDPLAVKIRARLPDGHWGAFSEEVTLIP